MMLSNFWSSPMTLNLKSYFSMTLLPISCNFLPSKLPLFGGRVHGTIHANRVKLNGSAIVEGDIFHRSLSIDENARFEGSSRREETVTDAPRIPISQLEAQADVDTVGLPVTSDGKRAMSVA